MVQDRGTTAPVAIGQDVYTRDGDHLGKVKEVQGDRFKIDASMQPDYWLPASALGRPLGNDLTVTFTKDQLGDHKVSAPSEGDRGTATGSGGSMTEEEKKAVSGFESTEVPYRTGFTASLADENWLGAEPQLREEWERRHAGSGLRWEEAAAGYRYAHGMSGNENYRGRDWQEVERDLEAGYPEWCRQEGYPEQDQDWSRARESTREAWTLIVRSR